MPQLIKTKHKVMPQMLSLPSASWDGSQTAPSHSEAVRLRGGQNQQRKIHINP